jgi:hypothetical protein
MLLTHIRSRLARLREPAIAGLVIILLAAAALISRFFFDFPHKWDPAEYCLCLDRNYLPHSPYVLYYLVGELFSLLAAPPAALSALSAVSGLAALAALFAGNSNLVTRLHRLPSPGHVPRVLGLAAAAMMAGCYLFVRQSGLQEVYAFQTALLLGALVGLGAPRHAAPLGGILFGLALACHNASIFAAPALVFALLVLHPERRLRGIALWSAAAATVYLVFALTAFVMIPPREGGSAGTDFVEYMRGIAPSADLTDLLDAGRRSKALDGLLERAFPAASVWKAGAVGTSAMHLWLVAAGLLAGLRVGWRIPVFWLLWASPYLVYEVALGRNLDLGIYLVFLVPAVTSLSALAAAAPTALSKKRRHGKKKRPGVFAWFVCAVIVALGALPSARRIADKWNAYEENLVRHYRADTLAARWMRNNLPTDAIVIEPLRRQNSNIVPYYSGRAHVTRHRGKRHLFVDRGPFTPLNIHSFEHLDTARLRSLLDTGRRVFAFEPRPFAIRAAGLDPSAFRVIRGPRADLTTTVDDLKLPADIASRLPSGSLQLFEVQRR